ncbi:10436_t:CDS:2, partial [Racocetra fulgida]
TFDGYEWHGRRLEVREDRSAMDFPPPPPRTEGLENEKISVSNGRSASVTSNEINGTTPSTQTSSSPVDYPNENITLNGISNNINNGTTYSDESTISNTSSIGTNGLNNNSNTNLQRQLFVGNLPFRVRWQDLKDLFRKAGTVLRADVAMGCDNRSKGHGTVLFGSLEDAKNAIGFVDSNGVNHQNNNNSNPQKIHQETRQMVDPVQNPSHAQAPYVPNAPMVCPTGIFFVNLKDLFRNAGNIIRADVSTNYDGRSRGFGTVLFATPEDARNAVGPFSPPLATPPLTSPPPFPATYNPLAHINSQPNTNSNSSAPFHPIPIHHGVGATSQQSSSQPQNIPQDQATATTASQFNGFGPIGKTNHSPQPNTSSSSISNLGAIGFPGTSTNSTLTTTNGLSSSVTVETDNSSKNVMVSTSITDGNANSTNNNNASSSVTPTSIV